MASENINALEILEQIQTQQSLAIRQLEVLRDSNIAEELNTAENKELMQIFEKVGNQSTDFAQVLGEINEQING